MTDVARTSLEKLAKLEAQLLQVPQVDCPVRHYFAPGLYAREINIPVGTVLVGAIHKIENLIVVSKGRLRMITDDGIKEVTAGDTFTCKAGMKNAAIALEDTRWTNFFPNPENITDTDKLVGVLTESTASDLLAGVTNLQIVANKAAERIKA